ncbi:MAG: gliding motility-associated C-terminal domain-containing protein [Flavobacteriales bacterium]|nr:gliding motility-associated C-terminal domain-containing protein [Flavobacteriales bacterium]
MFIGFLLSSITSFAQLQQPPNWHIFTTGNSGLADNRAYFLLYDQQSQVHWVATFNGGLGKVVGETITSFTTSNSNIPSDKLRTLTFAPNGILWMGTKDQGIISLDTNSLVFTTYNPGNSGFPSYESWGMTTDQFGNLWSAAGQQGLVKYDGATWTVYNTTNSGIADNWVNYVLEDSQGNIWAATGSGISKFDGATWTNYNSGDFSRVVIQTTDGKIWCASTTRLTSIVGTVLTDYVMSNSGIPSNDLSSLAEDQNGNLWIGTVTGGVAKYDGNSFQIFDVTNSTLPDNYIETIDISNLNRPWVGMNSGGLAGFVIDTTQIPEFILEFEVGTDTCYRHTGFAQVKVTGGTPPYIFMWNTIADSSHFYTDTVTNTNLIDGLLTGNYSVVVEDSDGYQVTGVVTVPRIEPPSAAFETRSKPVEFTDPTVLFDNESIGANSFEWHFGDGETTYEENPEHSYDTAGVYLVMLIAYGQPGFGCVDTTYGYVEVDPFFTFYVPNAFTPDGDGKNDTWGPVGLNYEVASYELEVFDRWGGLIWRTDNPLKWWDGTHMNSNERVKQGLYVYKFRLREFNTFEPKVFKGTVTLYRHN